MPTYAVADSRRLQAYARSSNVSRHRQTAMVGKGSPVRGRPRNLDRFPLQAMCRWLLRFVREPQESPDEHVVDPLALHALRVDPERHARVVVAELTHHPTQVSAGEEAEAR